MNNKGFEIIELLAVVMILVVALVIGITFYQEIDFGKHTGTIIDKQYHSAYVSYSTSYVNKSYINISTTHPARWSIKIQKKNKTLWIDVSSKEYSKLKIGDCYNCKNEKR